jgi:hypothetical protein
VERLTYILDVSPASGNKSVPIGLAAAVAAKDPRCAMVAQASFWRLSGGSSGGAQWHWHPIGLLSHLFLFASLFWSLLKHEVYKKHCSIVDLVRPMLMKRTRRWHWLVFCWCLGFLHMFSVLTVNAYM